MTKKLTALLMVVMMLLTLVGCGDETTEEAIGGPDIRGVIIAVEKNQAGGVGRIFVKGELEEGTSYDQAYISIVQDTNIVGEEQQGLSVDDLWVGKTVEVWFEGDVAESYPVQAKGKRVKVLNQT
ncbi:DUF3221 domain-containing protein [Alkaliphilus hydrothermalis]|uniref:DUF3221 domain-containing protein n=1 Tax=Alkaliphilus hydrothermalis TaxID=1482730 RepID=A0ABS2NN11_9FIRM|nr:DUF3221 domain-containing protein [Alkaliphilus hydrothermalis]MBM7614306.1 hypothetical protein [Alkaliphilus hydrothermalis]